MAESASSSLYRRSLNLFPSLTRRRSGRKKRPAFPAVKEGTAILVARIGGGSSEAPAPERETIVVAPAFTLYW